MEIGEGEGEREKPNAADSVHVACLVFCLVCMTAIEEYGMNSSDMSGW